ncbi:hypothetical protein [Vibrio sp. 99-70-13A1]|uniref:hypothetical protein n=1 Tax=Vibrio sp. 99-70-13A1 TaxID=2607601 RepID=UPI0014939D07|nr:tetratricopeptide repeat protein [Vibrio sp. 99-70-13A1]
MMKKHITLSLASLIFMGAFNAVAEPTIDSQDLNTHSQDLKSQTSTSTQNSMPEQQLAYQAQDMRESTSVRADALRQLASYPSQSSLVAVARGLKDQSEEVRESAVIGAEPYQFTNRWRMVSPLLKDSAKRVRITATTSLIRDYGNMTEEQQKAIETPVEELIAYLKTKPDSATSLLLADVYRWHKEWDKAETLYLSLLNPKVDGSSTVTDPQVWLSYADNYRAQEQDEQALKVLDNALALFADNAALYYSKSLTLVRLDDKKQAADAIQIAAELEPKNSYYWYLNGVLQETFDIDKSTQSFEQAYLISGAPEQLYAVCDIYTRYSHPKTDECLSELEKVAPPYVIQQLKEQRPKTVS